jgi:hypothetical protein
MDIGEPVSHYALEPGATVYSSDGEELGAVEHVLSEEELDVFDGIVFDGPAGRRFADAEQVAEIGERGVILTVDARGAEALAER